MKHILWIITAVVLINTTGYSTDAIVPTSQPKPSQAHEQYALAHSPDEEAVLMTAEEQAIAKRKDFVDSLPHFRIGTRSWTNNISSSIRTILPEKSGETK